jgi:hypothetical protein
LRCGCERLEDLVETVGCAFDADESGVAFAVMAVDRDGEDEGVALDDELNGYRGSVRGAYRASSCTFPSIGKLRNLIPFVLRVRYYGVVIDAAIGAFSG